MNTLDLLLNMDPPKLPTKEVKLLRLSESCQGDVVFLLQALSYSRVAKIRELSDSENMQVQIVLAGVQSPSFKDQGLMEKFHAATPAELVKAILLPGEIEDLSKEIERLSGYRKDTLEELKKK